MVWPVGTKTYASSPRGGDVPPAEHANAENTLKGTFDFNAVYFDNFDDGAVVVQQNIVTAVPCLIVVVTTILTSQVAIIAKATDIQRGGVTITAETTLSAADVNGRRFHLQYATEFLPAGNYTYQLVNTYGDILSSHGATIKIVAVS